MIKCEWKECSNKAEYLVYWNNRARPAIVHPFADYNLLCEKHLKEVKKNFPRTSKGFEICELRELTEKVQFT